MNNLTLLQRLAADTPPFFKKVHNFGLALIFLSLLLSGIAGIPAKALLIAGVVGGTLALISQFAVRDVAVVNAATSPIEGLIKVLPDLINQVNEVKNVVVGQSAVHGETLKSIAESLNVIASPPTVTVAPIPGVSIVNAASSPAPDASPSIGNTTDAVVIALNKAAAAAQNPDAENQ